MAKSRTGHALKRSGPKRKPYDRVLVVCEGSKTEPNYFKGIRQLLRLSSATVQIIPSSLGTEPLQIIDSAIYEFEKRKAYDKIFVVFDRDQHVTYANAIHRAQAMNNKLKNDERRSVSFEATVSVPSFELWLLLHFEDVQSWLHRQEASSKLKDHLPNYSKNMVDIYDQTKSMVNIAISRGTSLKAKFSRLPGTDPYTDVQELVVLLQHLND